MRYQHDPEGDRLPVKLDSTTNGEFEPTPLAPRNQIANRIAQEWASTNAKRSGKSRRDFLVSSCGVASTLLAINAVNAAAGKTGGRYAIDSDAAVDAELANSALKGKEFIFDVQGHYVPPNVAVSRKQRCAAHDWLSREYMRCLGADDFIKDIFLDADTDMMVLSFVPSERDSEPLTIAEADATRRIIDEMEGSHRLLLHGRVNPNQAGDLESMDELVEKWRVAAWKCYTQWGPDGNGFAFTDDVGLRFVDKACDLGVRNIAVHKGIPFGRRSYQHSLCTDIGPIAKMYPQVNFLIYHSGWIPGRAEGPYDPASGEGIDELIRSCQQAGIGPGDNVYAELGSTWRGLMQDPDSAAHALGKLFKYLGPDNVLWGTDSIWYGSPQDQIQAFRTFQIATELREAHGYPEITAELRAKVFGLNALKPYGISLTEAEQRASNDKISTQRSNYQQQRDPHFLTHGPKNRREFLSLLKAHGGQHV